MNDTEIGEGLGRGGRVVLFDESQVNGVLDLHGGGYQHSAQSETGIITSYKNIVACLHCCDKSSRVLTLRSELRTWVIQLYRV